MRDEELGCGALVFLSIIGLVLLFAGCYFSEKIECTAKGEALGYAYEYGLLTGCIFTKDNGKKVLLEQLRDIDN